LDGDKANCDYENLVALCQRCHLRLQAQYIPGQSWLPGTASAWAEKRGLG
jgi:5-methylcytosine-specific restriction endonuclease McrA